MERHWNSSHFGCAFPSPKNPITYPTYKVDGGLTDRPFQSATTAPNSHCNCHSGRQDYGQIFVDNFSYSGEQLHRNITQMHYGGQKGRKYKLWNSKFEPREKLKKLSKGRMEITQCNCQELQNGGQEARGSSKMEAKSSKMETKMLEKRATQHKTKKT
jgi:hypothetical protein